MLNFLKNITLVVAIWAFSQSSAIAQGVVHNIEGFPFMPGFAEDETRSLFFDKLEGRVLEGVITGTTTQSAAWQFYIQSLKQIGWVERPDQVLDIDSDASVLRFVKEGETLSLEFIEKNGQIEIKIFLVPSGS